MKKMVSIPSDISFAGRSQRCDMEVGASLSYALRHPCSSGSPPRNQGEACLA